MVNSVFVQNIPCVHPVFLQPLAPARLQFARAVLICLAAIVRFRQARHTGAGIVLLVCTVQRNGEVCLLSAAFVNSDVFPACPAVCRALDDKAHLPFKAGAPRFGPRAIDVAAVTCPLLGHRKLCCLKPVVHILRPVQVMLRFRLVFSICPVGRAEQSGAE